MAQGDEGAVYGYRARIGYTCPPVIAEVFPYEFYKVVPEGVTLAITTLAVLNATPDELQNSYDISLQAAKEMGAAGVDLVVLGGAPVNMAQGYDNIDKLIRETEEACGVPVTTSLTAKNNALGSPGLEAGRGCGVGPGLGRIIGVPRPGGVRGRGNGANALGAAAEPPGAAAVRCVGGGRAGAGQGAPGGRHPLLPLRTQGNHQQDRSNGRRDGRQRHQRQLRHHLGGAAPLRYPRVHFRLWEALPRAGNGLIVPGERGGDQGGDVIQSAVYVRNSRYMCQSRRAGRTRRGQG